MKPAELRKIIIAAVIFIASAGQVLAQTQASLVSGAITTAMTGTTSTLLVPVPDASLRNYITTIVCSNSHATVGTDIAVQDGNGGPTIMTIPAAANYQGTPQANMSTYPLKQPTPGNALYVANVTTGASTKCSAVGYKAP